MVIVAFVVTCGAELGYALIPQEFVVYVGLGPMLATSTPTTTSLKSTANHAITNQQARKPKAKERVFKTTKVKDQYGNTIYKDPPLTRRKEALVRTHEISCLLPLFS